MTMGWGLGADPKESDAYLKTKGPAGSVAQTTANLVAAVMRASAHKGDTVKFVSAMLSLKGQDMRYTAMRLGHPTTLSALTRGTGRAEFTQTLVKACRASESGNFTAQYWYIGGGFWSGLPDVAKGLATQAQDSRAYLAQLQN